MSLMPIGSSFRRKDDDDDEWTKYYEKPLEKKMNEKLVEVETGDAPIITGTITAEEKYKQHKEKLKTIMAEMREAAKSYFKETVNALFEANPVLESFSWTQYTPYFCDGDPCYFGVNCDLYELNGEEDPDYSDYDRTARKSKPKDDPLSKAGFAAMKLISSIEERDMEAMFGDHVKVTVTKEGITTEAYDHD
jgi:hypothetical protein